MSDSQYTLRTIAVEEGLYCEPTQEAFLVAILVQQVENGPQTNSNMQSHSGRRYQRLQRRPQHLKL